MDEKLTPTLDGKLRCLQTLLHQIGAHVACEAVAEARDKLAETRLTQPAQSVDVRAEDLQIEMFPPDPGGMRVYRPRGVKVTHKPTGITVACVHEGSQHANRDTALRALTAALQEKGNG